MRAAHAQWNHFQNRGERFIETFRRIGVKPFKERAYATHSQAA